jgi:hypothetical protein
VHVGFEVDKVTDSGTTFIPSTSTLLCRSALHTRLPPLGSEIMRQSTATKGWWERIYLFTYSFIHAFVIHLYIFICTFKSALCSSCEYHDDHRLHRTLVIFEVHGVEEKYTHNSGTESCHSVRNWKYFYSYFNQILHSLVVRLRNVCELHRRYTEHVSVYRNIFPNM